jgi:hypothetical protein
MAFTDSGINLFAILLIIGTFYSIHRITMEKNSSLSYSKILMTRTDIYPTTYEPVASEEEVKINIKSLMKKTYWNVVRLLIPFANDKQTTSESSKIMEYAEYIFYRAPINFFLIVFIILYIRQKHKLSRVSVITLFFIALYVITTCAFQYQARYQIMILPALFIAVSLQLARAPFQISGKSVLCYMLLVVLCGTLLNLQFAQKFRKAAGDQGRLVAAISKTAGLLVPETAPVMVSAETNLDWVQAGFAIRPRTALIVPPWYKDLGRYEILASRVGVQWLLCPESSVLPGRLSARPVPGGEIADPQKPYRFYRLP